MTTDLHTRLARISHILSNGGTVATERVIEALDEAAALAAAPSTSPAAAAVAGEPVALARRFHEVYERLAPQFGYETRADTKAFDPASPNGRLMTAVCAELAAPHPSPSAAAAEDGPGLDIDPKSTVGELAKHVGAWETSEGFVCFGSWMAVAAMHHHILKGAAEQWKQMYPSAAGQAAAGVQGEAFSLDALYEAMRLASLFAGSVASNDTHEAEARSQRLRSHLARFVARDVPDPAPAVERGVAEELPPAFDYAASKQMAVTKEWCRGWDDARAALSTPATQETTDEHR